MALSEQTPSGAYPARAVKPADVVELTVPAAHDATSAWCGPPPPVSPPASGFSLDEIEDLRIAVDEACVMLLSCPARRRPSRPR